MYILALDPGGITGWRTYSSGLFTAGFLGPDPHHKELWGFLDSVSADVVVCESFQHTTGKSTELISAEYVGIVKAWAGINDRKLVMQTSSEGKGFWNDDKLKRISLYVVNKHIRDATRHLLHYMSFDMKDEHWVRMLRNH